MAICSIVTSLDISIVDNEGRVDVSFFSESAMLESDMLVFAARIAMEVANDEVYDDLSQQSKRNTISELGFRGSIRHRWGI